MTFLAILLCAADDDLSEEGNIFCILHPTKKAKRLTARGISYAADMSVLLIKAKLCDDAADEKKHLCKALAALINDKRITDDKREFIASKLAELDKIEKTGKADPDLSSDCFAALCAGLFAPDFIKNEKTREALSWLGYNIGRWVYLIDAYEDLERDIKKGCYNPFATSRDGAKIKSENGEKIEEMLYFTLSQAAGAFDLLPIKRSKSLLENIIYIGLPARQNAVMHTARKE
jgi:hypothetical protein